MEPIQIILIFIGVVIVFAAWRLLLSIIIGCSAGGVLGIIVSSFVLMITEQLFKVKPEDAKALGILFGVISGLWIAVRTGKNIRKHLNPVKKTDKKYESDKNKKTTVMLIGQEAVGKTTLLALMYKEFLKNTRLNFVASDDTGIALENAYQKLYMIIEEPNFKEPSRLLPGTQGIAEYNFKISNLDFSIYDTAGGLIMTYEKNKDFEEFKNKLSKAVVVINVIDGAALIEGSIFLSERINSPTRMRDLLVKYKAEQTYLILFVITKCEKWIVNEQGIERLRNAFEERHKVVINWIENHKNIAGILMPVKTLGCVEFSYKEGKGEEEKLFFVKKPNLLFSQENVGKPLFYALQFSLRQNFMEIDKKFKIYGDISLIRKN